MKAKWVIYHRLKTVNVCQSTGRWFPHQIWSILPHRCHFNVWIWSVATPHKQKQRLPRTTERLLKKGPSSFDAQGNVKRFSAKIQSFVPQFGAPRHVGHPKGFTVTRAFQSIHELLQSSSLKIEVNRPTVNESSFKRCWWPNFIEKFIAEHCGYKNRNE